MIPTIPVFAVSGLRRVTDRVLGFTPTSHESAPDAEVTEPKMTPPAHAEGTKLAHRAAHHGAGRDVHDPQGRRDRPACTVALILGDRDGDVSELAGVIGEQRVAGEVLAGERVVVDPFGSLDVVPSTLANLRTIFCRFQTRSHLDPVLPTSPGNSPELTYRTRTHRRVRLDIREQSPGPHP